MKARIWTKNEVGKLLRMLETGHPAAVMAQLLGRSEASVRYKILNLGFSSRQVFEADEISRYDGPPFTDEIEVTEDEVALNAVQELERTEARRAVRDIVQDGKQDILETRILEEFRQRLGNIPIRIVIPPLPSSKFNREATRDTAVLVISDCHIGQVVDPRELDAASAYNPAVYLNRLAQLETNVQEILQSHPVEKLVVLLAGDIVHGRLGHSLEDDLTLPIVTQVDLALHSLTHVVGRLAAQVREVTIHSVAGNHGRWPGTRKVPTDRRWSNLDTIVAQSLQALCEATLPNVCFDERISSRRIVDVGDYRILLLHGDQLRGGTYAATGVQKELGRWLLRSAQQGQRAPDLLVAGDKHIAASLPVGFSDALINGSFVGEDVFSQNFNPSPPSQTLFFIRPDVGRTETHVIRLDKAAVLEQPPYQFKPSLQTLIDGFRQSPFDLRKTYEQN